MGLFGSQVHKLATRGDVEGLVALLGPLDKTDVQARHALIAIGADAVPALLACALGGRASAAEAESDAGAAGSQPTDPDEAVDRRAAAAHTVLLRIGEPTVRAVTGIIRSSDDGATVADAAELLYRTALALDRAVPDDVKAEVERKTGAGWADVVGERVDGRG